MLYGKNVTHTIGTYPYNQMLFYTFELATLLWVTGIVELAKSVSCARACHVAEISAIAAAGWGLYAMLETDARRERVEAERDPVVVLSQLRPLHDQFIGHYYYDPELEHASYFVTRAVLGRDSGHAALYRLHLHQRKPWELFREPELRGLFLPASVDPTTLLPGCPVERVGPFWKCDLETYRRTGDLERYAAKLEKRS
jgi:hypothetical protein